jgi:methylmalonyl-CoA mutase
MSAIIGGCDTLHILPFNFLNNENEQSKRIARNIGNILTLEADFNSIHNYSKGTYYIEYLTTEITKKAWTLFTEIENTGGIIESLHCNKLQQAILASREKELEKFKLGKQVLVGVNKYCSNEKAEMNKIKAVEPLTQTLIIQPLNDFLIAACL